MDGLQRSLEEAIKEMQGVPAAAGPEPEVTSGASPDQAGAPNLDAGSKTVTVLIPVPVPKAEPVSEMVSVSELLPFPERVLVQEPVPVQESVLVQETVPVSQLVVEKRNPVLVQEPVLMRETAPVSQLVVEKQKPVSVLTQVPVEQTIEEALATAPSVSPHYVPPPPPAPAPRVQPIEVPLLATQVMEPVFLPAPALAPRRMQPKEQIALPQQPEALLTQTMPMLPVPSVSRPPVHAENNNRNSVLVRSNDAGLHKPPSDDLDFGDVAEMAPGRGRDAKKNGDNVWRWTTIALSCVGGLASGWLGSSFSDQSDGIFQSDVQTVVSRASAAPDARLPVGIKMAHNGQSDKVLEQLMVTAKVDRALPMDENLCTVLELDRGTGLTLAKPCKPIVTTEFNSTLGKADLLVKTR